MSENTDSAGRTISPRVAAQRRLGAAEKQLARSRAYWSSERKRPVPPSVEVAEEEYRAAAEALKAVL